MSDGSFMAAYILFLLIIESVLFWTLHIPLVVGCWHFFLLAVIWMHGDGACL
jgi:hypothetical protein